jgi:hypothetical protein
LLPLLLPLVVLPSAAATAVVVTQFQFVRIVNVECKHCERTAVVVFRTICTTNSIIAGTIGAATATLMP